MLAILCSLSIFTQYTLACSVPVFRYALERWMPSAYKGIYIYSGEISEQDQALLEELANASNTDAPLNLIIKPVNADTFSKEKLEELLQGPIPDELPVLTIWYPGRMGKSPPFLKETLSPALVTKLVQSPIRHQIAEGLINGDSVVWIFIPSGSKEKDENALTMIRQELDLALKKFTNNPFTILDGSERKKLTYGFPVVTLSRDDPNEYILIETLMKSESDLYEHTDEPMIFPIFGRGRSLGCLFGEYITKEMIDDAATFLSAACSCEVKDQNPGVDLLIAAPWDVVVMNAFVQDDPLPELTGVMPEPEEPAANETPSPTVNETPSPTVNETPSSVSNIEPGNNSGLIIIFGGTLVGVMLVAGISGHIIIRRRNE